MNTNLSTLTGLLLSDGSIFFDRSKKTFCIQFTNKVKNLREIFKHLMKGCFGVTNFIEHEENKGISVRTFSKDIAEFLFKLSPTFRKLPCKSFPVHNHQLVQCTPVLDENGIEWPNCKIPEEIISNKELATSFLKGIFSGDGTIFVNENHRVFQVSLACEHPTLKKQVVECLNSLSIECWTKNSGVFISSKSDLKKFHDLVGFLPESTVCKKSRWFGLPKNKVLEIALDFLS